jgi:hypothetical protein
MLIQTCPMPSVSDAPFEERAQMIAERLASSTEGLSRGLDSLDSGGWQVLSHHVLETAGTLVVSFLVFRQRRVNS